MKKLVASSLVLAAAISSATHALQVETSYNGYARYGMGYSFDESYQGDLNNGINVIKAVGSQYASPGRLGNEGYGFELGVNNRFISDNGQIVDVYFMVDEYSGDFNNFGMAMGYARVSNIFESQPGASVWGGKRHYGRNYIGQNDYFYLMNDGTGGGIDDLDLGFGKLDVGLIAGDNGNNGRYGLISEVHGIQITDSVDFGFNLNYGFGNNNITPSDAAKANNAWQFAAYTGQNWSMGRNEFHMRISDGARNGVMGDDVQEDLRSMLFLVNGSVNFSNNASLEYLALYENNKDFDQVKDGNVLVDAPDEKHMQFVITPVYRYNDVHSTRFEFGYDQVKFNNIKDAGFSKNSATNSAWRFGVEQVVQLNSFGWPSPAVRFFLNHGQLDTEYVPVGTTADKDANSVTTVGIMFDASW